MKNLTFLTFLVPGGHNSDPREKMTDIVLTVFLNSFLLFFPVSLALLVFFFFLLDGGQKTPPTQEKVTQTPHPHPAVGYSKNDVYMKYFSNNFRSIKNGGNYGQNCVFLGSLWLGNHDLEVLWVELEQILQFEGWLLKFWSCLRLGNLPYSIFASIKFWTNGDFSSFSLAIWDQKQKKL